MTENSKSFESVLGQFDNDDRKLILVARANDIVGTVRSRDANLWWEEPHSSLDGKTPLEILTVSPVSESVVLLMRAAVNTAKSASKIIIF